MKRTRTSSIYENTEGNDEMESFIETVKISKLEREYLDKLWKTYGYNENPIGKTVKDYLGNTGMVIELWKDEAIVLYTNDVRIHWPHERVQTFLKTDMHEIYISSLCKGTGSAKSIGLSKDYVGTIINFNEYVGTRSKKRLMTVKYKIVGYEPTRKKYKIVGVAIKTPYIQNIFTTLVCK